MLQRANRVVGQGDRKGQPYKDPFSPEQLSVIFVGAGPCGRLRAWILDVQTIDIRPYSQGQGISRELVGKERLCAHPTGTTADRSYVCIET
jgi:hypothetical protein